MHTHLLQGRLGTDVAGGAAQWKWASLNPKGYET